MPNGQYITRQYTSVLVAASGGGGGGPAFVVGSGLGLYTSTLTQSYTCSGTNRFMVVQITLYNSGTTITGVTFNGVAMTLFTGTDGNIADGSGKRAAFYLINPAATTANIVVTLSLGTNIALAVATFENVNQSVPFGALTIDASDALATATITPASNVGDLVVAMSAYYDNSTGTPGSDGVGQSLAAAGEAGSPNMASRISYKAGSASTTSMSTTAATKVGIIAGFALKP